MSEKDSDKVSGVEDNLFEEPVLDSSSYSKSESSPQEEYSDIIQEDNVLDSTEEFDTEDDIDYSPGDLVDLQRLFDEDEEVAPSNNDDSTVLDFEEIPDDIDIDEPIEIEELSRAGRIMNVVVQASLIIFGLIVLGFIINAGLVVGAVLSSDFQKRIFINVSNLDKKTARIDATVMTEASNFGSFIVGELDPAQPVRVVVFLSNEETVQSQDAICEVIYQPPKDKDKIIKFNGGKRNVIHLENIELKLNPNFDASRLSGFMEPKSGEKFHERYPRNLIINYSVNLRINSFWVPIPYKFSNMFTKIEMDKPDSKIIEKMKLERMKAFDFNPKYVDISSSTEDGLTINVRQPVPKFYAPPFYKVAIHIPEMELVIKQFTNTNPEATPNIKTLYNEQSSPLMTAKVGAFRMTMSDYDLTPNIVDIEAKVDKNNLTGVINVLKAMRDDKLNTLAFLFASKGFDPEKQHKPVKPVEPSSSSSAEPKEPDPIEGCKFTDFMKTFWGRQAYPVSDKDGPALPSLPESYIPGQDSAVKIEFNGIKTVEEAIRSEGKDAKLIRNFLDFKATASTHYIISEYKLPLLMLTGQLPPIQFKMLVNSAGKSAEVAKFIIKHVNTNIPPVKEDDKAVEDGKKGEEKKKSKKDIYPFGDHMIFDISVEILDLKLLSHFALKLSRMSKIKPREGFNTQLIIGKMFKNIEGAVISADYDSRTSSWVSKIASVFNMKFNLSGDKVEFLYVGNDKPVIPENDKSKKNETEYSKEAEDSIIKSLDDILGVVFEKKPEAEESETKANERHENMILEKIEELKKKVAETENIFHQESNVKSNFAEKAKIDCENAISKSSGTVVAKPFSEVVNELDITCVPKLEYHEKLVKVRKLLNSRINLRKRIPITKEIVQNGLFTKISSNLTIMTIKTALALNESEHLFVDHFLFTWNKFEVALADDKNIELVNMIFEPGELKYFPCDGSLSRSKNPSKNSIKFKTKFGPKKDGLTVTEWMKSFRIFVDGLLSKKYYFISYNLSVIFPSSKASVKWSSELPTAAMPALPSSTASSAKNPLEPIEPGFFDNLAKSHIDFIGYGFYRLIFHAILPNPDECPSGSSILNVELELPQTALYLFASADSQGLWENTCVASINTAKPLRIWTQIVDGVLCNMYAVADGLIEQEATIQARISDERASKIIESFKDVIKLRNSYGVKKKKGKESESNVSKIITESPILNYREKIGFEMSKVAANDRYALITAVPISLEFLNFERMIKIVDAMGRKERIKLGSTDLTTSKFEPSQEPNLFNILTNALAGNFPVEFNTPDQLKKAENDQPKVIFSKEDQKIVLNVNITESNSKELSVKTSIAMPDYPNEAKPDKDNVPYVFYESLLPEERFLHPVIRWGSTELTFALPKFKLTLKLSAGDIQVTNDGSKILFDALKNFEIEFSIKAHSEKKSFKQEKYIFKSSSIRQFFSKCRDYVRNYVNDSDDFGDPIKTTSIVSYGPNDNQKFFFLGLANVESFLLLQGAVIRRMFPENTEIDESYDPREDPTYMDFGMLISLGNGTKGDDVSKLAKLNVPCFFTNFCSSEQLGYSKLNSKSLLSKKDHINATLTIGNTFGPLAASIAAGFSTFLPLFYMDVYPGTLEWQMSIPDDQVLGLEMNGQGMVYGKAEAFKIERTAEIPYPNCHALEDKKKKKKKEKVSNSNVETEDLGASPYFSDRENFNTKFFKIEKQKFNDSVDIKVKAQVPDSLPHLFRNFLWPIFFSYTSNTMTIHPPIINIESDTNYSELSHAPISVALSDSMEYKDSKGKNFKPSILTSIFAAFIEENSSIGLELHKPYDGPSSIRTYSSLNFDSYITILSTIKSRIENGQSLMIGTVWIQMPWPLGPIGFDFGESLRFGVTLPEFGSTIILNGVMSQHQMIGKTARMRIDIAVPNMNLETWTNVLIKLTPVIKKIAASYATGDWKKIFFEYLSSTFLKSYTKNLSYASGMKDIPINAVFNVDNNFLAETELVIPKDFCESPKHPTGSVSPVKLTPTDFDVAKLISKYSGKAPEALVCIYNKRITDADTRKQSELWTQLDLSMTRVYYQEIAQIKPGDEIKLFLQLRTVNQIAVCGTLSIYHGLAVMIEYIKPEYPLDVLFKKGVTAADCPRTYVQAGFDPVTSVYLVKPKLELTGRYRIYAALIPSNMKIPTKEKDFKKLRYKQIKFTEIYVQHTR